MIPLQPGNLKESQSNIIFQKVAQRAGELFQEAYERKLTAFTSGESNLSTSHMIIEVKTGECFRTTAGKLAAKYIIHIFVPQWNGGNG